MSAPDESCSPLDAVGLPLDAMVAAVAAAAACVTLLITVVVAAVVVEAVCRAATVVVDGDDEAVAAFTIFVTVLTVAVAMLDARVLVATVAPLAVVVDP